MKYCLKKWKCLILEAQTGPGFAAIFCTGTIYLNLDTNTENIICGVPQGKILGPLLFFAKCKWFSQCFKFPTFLQSCLLITWAFFKNRKTYTHCLTWLTESYYTINNWFIFDKILLRVGKTKFIIFHNPKR